MLKVHTGIMIFACLFLSTHCLQAQAEWAPIGATWHYTFHHFGGEREFLKLESMKDTIIDDTNAKVLSQTIHRVDGELDHSLGNLYIYQEDNQIYLWIKERFELLYDFDAEVGDTLKLLAPTDRVLFPGDDSLMYLRVDSVQFFVVDGQELKGQYLDPIDKGANEFSFQFSGWNLEKIGNQQYFIAWNQLECDNECADVFRCYEDNSLSYHAVDYPCDTIVERLVSTRDAEKLQNSLQVYQNPIMVGNSLDFSMQASSTVTTELGPISYEVSDVSGRRIVPITVMQDREQSLSTAGFPPGIYFLIVRSRGGVAQERIVIY